MNSGNGLVAHALPTARTALGLPTARASFAYVVVSPNGTFASSRSTDARNSVTPDKSSGTVNSRRVPAKYSVSSWVTRGLTGGSSIGSGSPSKHTRVTPRPLAAKRNGPIGEVNMQLRVAPRAGNCAKILAMHRRLTTALACAAALTLAACGSSSDTIAGTSPAIASAVCDGDDGCESDMRELSHKLDASDDADGDGIIDREELDAALKRLDKEAEEKEAAASSSAAAASSSAAAASKSAEAEREAAKREAAEREAAQREAAEREAAQREAANQQQQQQQQAPEPAPQQQAPQQPSGPPAMEWATLGPYGSLFTCEQARDVWPVDSHACYTGADGNAYFEGMRQAAQ